MALQLFCLESARADFELAALRAQLNELGAAPHTMEAQYFCVATLSAPPSAGLAELLGATATALPDWPATEQRLAVPRRGMISAWGDKAQAIVRRAGMGCERLERGIAWHIAPAPNWDELRELLCDRMVEELVDGSDQLATLLQVQQPAGLESIYVMGADGWRHLQAAEKRLGLGLTGNELRHLYFLFKSQLRRNPSDVELMSYAQIHSEHCRHKVFNRVWEVQQSDGRALTYSLMDMIRRTSRGVAGIHSAYKDNAAVFASLPLAEFAPEEEGAGGNYCYRQRAGQLHLVAKVETHNHPTAISPFPGAGTGIGGELRDEAAVGRGGRSVAGLCGFSVSHLRLPNAEQPWEGQPLPAPALASPLDIMLQAPLGGAAFANEFGRPTLCGYFRSFEQLRNRRLSEGQESRYGYHKPIMLAGGLGIVRPEHVHSQVDELSDGDCLIVLGGPALRIGLGGGSSSSRLAGSADASLDFASVQRQNPEMQRRCQELIDRCRRLGKDNPIALIHDVGAGGLCNALPELVWELSSDEPVQQLLKDGSDIRQRLEKVRLEEKWTARFGAEVDLRAIPSGDASLSPLELWCNEAQERFVLIVRRNSLDAFGLLCAREDCPWAKVGELRHRQRKPQSSKGLFVVHDGDPPAPLELPLPHLFLAAPDQRTGNRRADRQLELSVPKSHRLGAGIAVDDAAHRILKFPTVAAKNFLITIGDRTVGGLSCRDQLVGPWQVPVADVATVALGYDTLLGGALALGERTPLAVYSPAAAARMAVGEALTNLVAAPLSAVEPSAALTAAVLSANWMSASTEGNQSALVQHQLHDAVQALSSLCVDLGVAVPVGKDSLSMEVRWTTPSGGRHRVAAPLSPVISAFAPVANVCATLTPQLRDVPNSTLLLIDLGAGCARLGGSCLAQVYGRELGAPPDLDNAAHISAFFAAVQDCLAEGLLWAYHDRSDGGLFACLCEMSFASRLGFDVELPAVGDDAFTLAQLFNEELGAVVQCGDEAAVRERCRRHGLPDSCLYSLGRPTGSGAPLRFLSAGEELLCGDRAEWQALWQETSYRMQSLRDHPDCAREEFEAVADETDGGLVVQQLSFDPTAVPHINTGARPRLAVLRDRGSNGHYEMAAAFDRAGFECLDVHTTDLVTGRQTLADCQGLAACGGFSCGDVLGAGRGWAAALAGDARSRDAMAAFLTRTDSFALGICNGCQMLADPLWQQWIPGSKDWPRFAVNRSRRFESRWVMVELQNSPSLLLSGMAGSQLPVPVAHAEGRADFSVAADGALARLESAHCVALRYIDHRGDIAGRYPANPAGAPFGLAGLCSADGRVTIMMPHPERAFRTAQYSYVPADWGESAPWLRLFHNARQWLG